MLIVSFFCGNNFLPISSAPSQLQPIIAQVSDHLNIYTSTKELKAICRRIINCCFNGGVPIDLLNRFEVLTGSNVNYNHRTVENIPENLTAQHIVSAEEITSIKLDLEQQIHNFMNHLSFDSSEAQYRSLYWDQFISTCFFLKDKANLTNQPIEDSAYQDVPYKLQSEWSSLEMFPNLEPRKVDYVAMFTGRDMNLMILLIEAGKEPFGLGVESHKDFSKLLAIMSKTCTKMAVDLENSGKKAEDAVVIGAWIGGHQIHFAIAKSVITRTANLYEVNCNLHFPDQWKFDLLIPKPFLTFMETSSGSDEALTLSSSEISNEDFTMTDENFDTEHVESQIESDVGDDVTQLLGNIDNYDLNEESDSDDERSLFASTLRRGVNQGKLSEKNEINYVSMCMIRNFFDYAYDILKKFNSAASDRGTDVAARNFLDPSSGGVFYASRKSALDETPNRTRTHETSRITFSNSIKSSQISGNIYSLVKSSENELKIYREYLQLIPSVFPQLYFTEPDPEHADATIFHFEDMEPLIYPYSGNVNELLEFSGLEDGLRGALWMILDLSHCLYNLHYICGLVHSDISPQNIMFSEKYNVWKLIDFDQTMKIKQSLVTARIAGTKGYIAPESIESSIFTFESDVYSLGVIFRDYLYYGLMNHVVSHEGDEDVDKNLVGIFYALEKLILDMATKDLSKRISLISAIKGFVNLVKRFEDYKYYGKYRNSIRFFERLQLICENSSNESEILEEVEAKTKTKSVKVYEEKIVEKVQILKSAKT